MDPATLSTLSRACRSAGWCMGSCSTSMASSSSSGDLMTANRAAEQSVATLRRPQQPSGIMASRCPGHAGSLSMSQSLCMQCEGGHVASAAGSWGIKCCDVARRVRCTGAVRHSSNVTVEDDAVHSWQVCMGALPPGISLVTAEAVLFLGKAQRILLRWPGSKKARHAAATPSAAVQQFSKTLRELQRQPTLDQIRLEQAISAAHGEVSSLSALPNWFL